MKGHLIFALYLILVAVLAACGSEISNNPQPTQTTPPVVEFVTPTPAPTHTIAILEGSTLVPTPTETQTASAEPIISTPPETNVEIITPTVVSTETIVVQITETPIVKITVTCADIDANWGQNWTETLEVLDQLIAAGQSCGEEPLTSKKYAAHFTYAASLENSGDLKTAIPQYQAALLTDPQRSEALDALIRLNALPEPTPVACHSTLAPLPDPAPTETPDLSLFVTTQGDQLQLNGQLFKVKGVNYYPRHAPWHHFLEEANSSEMATELELIQAAGFNTIRVFLRYEPLFICQPEDAIPNEATFAKVDTLFHLARERDLKLIVTLNDLPDLIFRPLYKDWAHYDAQTTYIVRRYRNEPNILAWDLRNEGDLDYGVRPEDEARFSQEEVITWLAHTSQLVRENDPHHLLTSGWWGDPTPTALYVDILSFHHWAEADQLQARISDYQQRNDKPLMLQEVGYHSWAEAPHDQRDGQGQADILGRVINVAQDEGISGWIVWTAFDFVPQPGQPLNYEHFFGLWQADLTPKPALEVLPLE